MLNNNFRVKTPTILQMEAVECGAASLAIILAYYRRFIPLETLRVECGVSRDGSKASSLVKVARLHGLEAKGYKIGLDEIKTIKEPWIAFWNFNHFLVIEGFSKDKIYLNDPASGPRAVSWDEFDKGFTGIMLKMRPGENFQRLGREKSVLPALKKRLVQNKSSILFLVLAGLSLAIVDIVVPSFTRIFVDHVLLRQQTAWEKPLLISIAIAAMLQWGVGWLQYRQLIYAQLSLSTFDTSRLFWKLIHRPILFFTQRYPGDLVMRISLSERLAKSLFGGISINIVNLLMTFFFVIMMLQYSLLLTVVAVSIALGNVLILYLLSRSRVNESHRLQAELSKLWGVALSGLGMIDSLKACGGSSSFFARFTGYQAKEVTAAQKLGEASRLLDITPGLLSAINTSLILIIGGDLVMTKAISVGELVAFQLLAASLLAPVSGLVGLSSQLQEVQGDLARVDDILKYEDPQEKSLPSKEFNKKLSGYVKIDRLTFGYNPTEKPLIEEFSLDAVPGTRVAIVGGTGSGKSTIIRLITGLYPSWSGKILFDRVSRTDLNKSIIESSLSLVEQNCSIFEGSIRDNLTLWDPEISTYNLKRALEDAELTSVVQNLGGLDAHLAEGGANLSGGQRQRLEIARSLCHNPSILILDEATSALDTATEALIDRNLRQRKCTCIIVAHRLSTVRDADEIIVLDVGKVVGRGAHEELMKQCEVYKELINAQ